MQPKNRRKTMKRAILLLMAAVIAMSAYQAHSSENHMTIQTKEKEIVNSTRKCNSMVWVKGPAAVASWLDLTDQSERSTHERIYAADPSRTISDLHLEESRA
jgi:hypothetical protein